MLPLMKRTLLILAAASLPACSHGATSGLQALAQRMADTFKSQPQQIPTVTVSSSNNTALPAQQPSLPIGYSSNRGSVPVNYNNGAWSSNLSNLSQPAAVAT